jgi:tetratricopeptide (TPR) repeat protein
LLITIALSVVITGTVGAQPAQQAITDGDRAYSAHDARAALASYEMAARTDTLSYEAAWKTSRSAADMEVRARGTADHSALLRTAELFARRAVALRADSAEGHFALARALGIAARSMGARERVRYAGDVRNHALQCLRYDPGHSGCLHVMGAWNAEVMRLGRVERFIARRLLGGSTFGSASWNEAVRYMEAAVAAGPRRIVHRVELAEIYEDVGRTADAEREYEAALTLPVDDFNDPVYQRMARTALDRMKRTPNP